MQYTEKVVLTILFLIVFMVILSKPFRESYSKKAHKIYDGICGFLVFIALPISVIFSIWD